MDNLTAGLIALMAPLASFIARLRNQKMALAAAIAMGLKGAGALLTIVIFTLAARAMSAEDFGQLAVWFNAMSFLAVAAVFGQDTLIARSWGEYSGRGEPETARGAYWFGWRTTLISALAFVAVLLVFAPYTNAKIAPAALFAGAAFLFMQTILHYSSHTTRVLIGFAVSETGRELIWRLTLLLVIIWAVLHQGLTPAEFFYAGAAGMVLSVIFQSMAVRRKFAREPVAFTSESEKSEWYKRGGAMWLSAIVEAASQYADVMLIGYFASPAAAGDYFVAARIANIFLMVQTGLNTYSVTHSANLYFSGQIGHLQAILRSVACVAAAIAAPCLALILVYGQPILTLFGERYGAAYPTLAVLAIAAFTMSMCGAASGLLLTTGHERLYSRVVTLATAARMAVTAILAMHYGAFGAACGWAIVNIPLAISLTYICRKSCGVDPSVISISRRSRAAPLKPAQKGAA